MSFVLDSKVVQNSTGTYSLTLGKVAQIEANKDKIVTEISLFGDLADVLFEAKELTGKELGKKLSAQSDILPTVLSDYYPDGTTLEYSLIIVGGDVVKVYHGQGKKKGVTIQGKRGGGEDEANQEKKKEPHQQTGFSIIDRKELDKQVAEAIERAEQATVENFAAVEDPARAAIACKFTFPVEGNSPLESDSTGRVIHRLGYRLQVTKRGASGDVAQKKEYTGFVKVDFGDFDLDTRRIEIDVKDLEQKVRTHFQEFTRGAKE